MFKIARAGLSQFPIPGALSLSECSQEMLGQFCVSEAWSGDLSNGLFRIGDNAASLHGLEQTECGLLNLVRCYDQTDRNHVLELFEQAATTSSSFCYSTTIVTLSGRKQPVFCVGESSGLEQRYSGTLQGIFFFPRFQLETRSYLASHQ
ncbi:hypothetical protein [Pararhizobium arenae]|uniref:hypothetical protein n=1 Tax=Pararhizobium arenae TaxID=1856850 RepID=UPI00094B6731|nr:hypothetical protein [Pararhizobium arenae]